MDRAAAQRFLEQLATDAQLRQALEQAGDDMTRNRLIKEAGYGFNHAEIQQLLATEIDELLDETDLDAVAGGWKVPRK